MVATAGSSSNDEASVITFAEGSGTTPDEMSSATHDRPGVRGSTAMAERRRTKRSLAIARVAAQLASLSMDAAQPVVVEAGTTPIYLQFARDGEVVVGEAVAIARLPRLLAYHYRDVLEARLRELDWSEPSGDAPAGNWTRRWPVQGWDPETVAKVAVATLERAYGIAPWAIVVAPANVG